MKQLTVHALLAAGAMIASSMASALPIPVYLLQDGLRSAGGTTYNLIFDGSDGAAASTATWTWDAATGVLNQTGGTLLANERIGSTPGPFASLIYSDQVTGLIIDTGAGTTNATTYQCNEGGFGGGTGANSCGGYGLGGNNVDESTRFYNVGGDASCTNIVAGGDDTGIGPATPYRGLWSDATCGNHSGRGALDMIQISQDNTGIGGYLILANWNSDAQVDTQCIRTVGVDSGSNPNCNRAHWLTFQTAPVPVPAAVWLFGSSLGLLGLARRRLAA